MSWKADIMGYKTYLRLEKSLSANSIEAYEHDILKLVQFLEFIKIDDPASQIKTEQLRDFLKL